MLPSTFLFIDENPDITQEEFDRIPLPSLTTIEVGSRCSVSFENTYLAKHIAERTDFGMVQGISEECQGLVEALEKYARWEAPFNILLVDMVLTTDESMEQAKAAIPPQVHRDDIIGWVVVTRAEPPAWVNDIFKLFDKSKCGEMVYKDKAEFGGGE